MGRCQHECAFSRKWRRVISLLLRCLRLPMLWPGLPWMRLRAPGQIRQVLCSAHGRKEWATRRFIYAASRRSRAVDTALPATPETYLALRASHFELHVLPETSFEALIYEAGKAGLSGLLGRIISDVLAHRAADAGTARQHRLLLALLAMASTCQKQVPVAPDIVVKLASEYVKGAGLDALTPPLAAHIMRSALMVSRRSGTQHDLVQTMFHHLFNTAEYPLLEEGLHVIEYMMRYETAAPSSIMNFVSKTADVDGERLGEHTLEQARADGFAWHRWARSASGYVAVNELKHGKADDVQAYAFRITMWSLCCRAWIRLNRATRFREAFTSLQREYSVATEAVTLGAQTSAPPAIAVLRALLQTHLVQLASLYTPNAVRTALATLRYVAPPQVAQVGLAVVQMLCYRAAELGDLRTAAAILQRYTACLDVHQGEHALRAMHHNLLLDILMYLSNTPHAPVAARWASSVAKGANGTYMDTFPEPLQSRWILCLCALGLRDEARELYISWTGSLGVPLDRRTYASLLARHPSAKPDDAFITRVFGTFQVEEVQSGVREELSPLDSRIPRTPACMLAMVRLMVRTDMDAFARAVRDDFFVCTYARRGAPSHHHLTALMQASFLLRDTTTALHVLQTMHAYGYGLDACDVSVLLGGVADTAPRAAVAMLEDLPENMADNVRMYAVVLSRCIQAKAFHLADRVLALASERHLGLQLVQHAPASVFACSRDKPVALVNRAISMMRDGWEPKPALLNWMIRTAVRGMSLREARESTIPYGISHEYDVAAAVRLFCYAAEKRQYADFPTARLLLYHIALLTTRTSASVSASSKRSLWSSRTDAILGALFAASVRTGADKCGTALFSCSKSALPIPAPIVQEALLTYKSLHDHVGVEELLTWLHTHDPLAVAALSHADRDNVRSLSEYACDVPSRTKSWWASCTKP